MNHWTPEGSESLKEQERKRGLGLEKGKEGGGHKLKERKDSGQTGKAKKRSVPVPTSGS